MAQAGQCPGTDWPIGVPGKVCVKAKQAVPDAELWSTGIQIVVLTLSSFFILLQLNRMLYWIAKWKFGKDKIHPIRSLRFWACFINCVDCAAALLSRTADYNNMNNKGVTAYTIMVMINFGGVLVSIALLTMFYVNLKLRHHDMRPNAGYTKTTKIVCILFIIGALFQMAFYAGVSIQYKGKEPKWIKRTHYATMGINIAAAIVPWCMLFIAKFINEKSHGSKLKEAALCVTWGVITSFLSLCNVFIVAYYFFGKNTISPNLMPLLQKFIGLQQELTPFLMVNMLLFIVASVQHAMNLYLMAMDSDELFFFGGTFRWLRYLIFGTKYTFIDFHVTTSGGSQRNTTANNNSITVVEPRRTAGAGNLTTTDDTTLSAGLVSVIYESDVEMPEMPPSDASVA